MNANAPDSQRLLAEIESLSDEVAGLLCSAQAFQSESGIVEIEAKILGLNARLEHLVERGPEWARKLACDGIEHVRQASDEVAIVRQAWNEADRNTSVLRGRELLETLGVKGFLGTPAEPDVLDMHAEYAAEIGAERLPVHGEILEKWTKRLSATVQASTLEVGDGETKAFLADGRGREITMKPGEAAVLISKECPWLQESYCKTLPSKELKDPKHRTPDQRRIYRASVDALVKDKERIRALGE